MALSSRDCKLACLAASLTFWGDSVPSIARISAVTMTLAGLVTSHAGSAQPSGAGGSWVAYPISADFAAGAPEASKSGQGGRAVAKCRVEDGGELSGCILLRETPTGQGIGAALLAMSPKFRRAPPGPKDLREVLIDADWFRVDAPTDWKQKPSASELLAVYPTAGKGVDGRAVISCLVTVQGALTDCEAVAERPVGLGFGNAAIALTSQFTMKPVTWQGSPARTVVRIPINWEGFSSAMVSGPGTRRVVPANLPWMEAPSFADVSAAYPKKARAEKRAGHVALACEMTEEGRLGHCSVGATDPVGMGFEGAAKDLAKMFRFRVATEADRKATRSLTVHLPITFDPAALDQALVGKPNWSVLPTLEQTGAVFKDLKVTGTARAVVECTVQPGGSVGECHLVSETPAGVGMGPAAMTMTPYFRLTTWTTEGLPIVGGTIRIPIRYDPPPAAPPPK